MMDELDAGLGPTEAEPPPRLLTEDVTPEGLASLLADHGRIIAASDEGSALFENLAGRYARGSVSWDLFNKAHSGVDLAIDRKSSGRGDRVRPGADARARDAAGDAADARRQARRRRPRRPRTPAVRAPGARAHGRARPAAADADVLAEYERRIRDVYSDTPELETDEDGHPRPIDAHVRRAARERSSRTFEAELNRERRELAGDDVDERERLPRLALEARRADGADRGRPPLRRELDRRLRHRRARRSTRPLSSARSRSPATTARTRSACSG